MNVRCPTCGAEIGQDDVNVARDLALCRSCGRTCSFAENADVDLPSGYPGDPPEGAWYEETPDGFLVGSTTRSRRLTFNVIMFSFVWLVASLISVSEPSISRGKFGLLPTFLDLFSISLATITLALLLVSIAGCVTVRVSGDRGHVFTGVGRVGWRRRFSWNEVLTVGEAVSPSEDAPPVRTIRVSGIRTLTFGSLLSQPRRRFLIGVLRRELRRRGKPKSPAGHSGEFLGS